MDPKWMVQSALLHCALYYCALTTHEALQAALTQSHLSSNLNTPGLHGVSRRLDTAVDGDLCQCCSWSVSLA